MSPRGECLGLTITHSDDPDFSRHFVLQANNDKDVVKIGRSQNAHIRVVREGISAVHVELRAVSLVPGARPALMARDLSKNGVGVNFVAGEKKPLKNGVDMLIPDRTSLLMPILTKNKEEAATEDPHKPGEKRVLITLSFDDAAPPATEDAASGTDELVPPPPPPRRKKLSELEVPQDSLQSQDKDSSTKTQQSAAAPASEAQLTGENIEATSATVSSQPLPQKARQSASAPANKAQLTAANIEAMTATTTSQPLPQPAPQLSPQLMPQPALQLLSQASSSLALPPGPQSALQQLLQPIQQPTPHSLEQSMQQTAQPDKESSANGPAPKLETLEDRTQQLNHLKQWLLGTSSAAPSVVPPVVPFAVPSNGVAVGASQPPLTSFPVLPPTSASELAVPDPLAAMSAWTKEFTAAIELAAALEIARKDSYQAVASSSVPSLDREPPIDLDMLDAPVADAPMLVEDDPAKEPLPFENPTVEQVAARIKSANANGGILVILSISGLLLKMGKKNLVPELRPYLSKFHEVFDRHASRLKVGVWSTMPTQELQPLVLRAFGAKRAKRLAFVWDRKHCQTRWVPGEDEPALCKDFEHLRQSFWGSYAPDRILIVDSDPTKLANVPAGIAVHPSTFAIIPDDELKRLAAYIEGLAVSGRHVSVVDYVSKQPFLSRSGRVAALRRTRQGSMSPSPEMRSKRDAQQMEAAETLEAYLPDDDQLLPVTLEKTLENGKLGSVLRPTALRRRPPPPRTGRMMYVQPQPKKAARLAARDVDGEGPGEAEAAADCSEWQRLASRTTSDYYYFNRKTCDCQLEPPAPWQRRSSRTQPGVFYYWNPVTGQACPQKPEVDSA